MELTPNVTQLNKIELNETDKVHDYKSTTCNVPMDKNSNKDDIPEKIDMAPEQRGIKESYSVRFPTVSKYNFRKRQKAVTYYEELSTTEPSDGESTFDDDIT